MCSNANPLHPSNVVLFVLQRSWKVSRWFLSWRESLSSHVSSISYRLVCLFESTGSLSLYLPVASMLNLSTIRSSNFPAPKLWTPNFGIQTNSGVQEFRMEFSMYICSRSSFRRVAVKNTDKEFQIDLSFVTRTTWCSVFGHVSVSLTWICKWELANENLTKVVKTFLFLKVPALKVLASFLWLSSRHSSPQKTLLFWCCFCGICFCRNQIFRWTTRRASALEKSKIMNLEKAVVCREHLVHGEQEQRIVQRVGEKSRWKASIAPFSMKTFHVSKKFLVKIEPSPQTGHRF